MNDRGTSSVDVTRLLESAHAGDQTAVNRIFSVVYDELRRIANSKMQGERQGITIQPTALVNEVWIKLIGKKANVQFETRGHFFVAAAEAMQQILVDAARARKSLKRGGNANRIEMENLQLSDAPPDDQLIELHEALCDFEKSFPMKAKVVKLRYFGGMTNAETAQHLNMSTATAERYWAFSRAWLKRILG